MATILNIETSTMVCSVALSVDGKVVAIEESLEKNSHAKNITIFSEKVIENAGISFNQLDAVAVSMGPGSYTGLRIGVSTAKGFCYAIDKPLIAINTLKSLAAGMRTQIKNTQDFLLCPMIDAKRMEVYYAFFDSNLNEVRETKAEVIDSNSFDDVFAKHKMIFAGDGSAKCKTFLGYHKNALFLDNYLPSSGNMCVLSEQSFNEKKFEDVAYFEPFYLKDFVAGIPRVKGLR